MITLIIDGIPVPWAAHKGYGKRSFKPRFKEREYYRWQIKAQYNQEKPIAGPVRLSLSFHLPIPKATSKVRRLQMLNGVMHHITRPDVSNFCKFAEDTLKGIVIEDDSQVVEINAKKIYADIPKTVISIFPF